MNEFNTDIESALEIATAAVITIVITKALRRALKSRTNKSKTAK